MAEMVGSAVVQETRNSINDRAVVVLMAEAVGSAVVQETVSRAVSFVLCNSETAASKRHNIERLEMAHTELEFALERSRKLPITDVSLLRQRRMVKRVYEECGDVLHRCKLRIQEDEKVEQGVTQSSLPKRIIHTVKSFISSSVSLKNDELTCSDLRRFEWFADKARKFIRDVETGCSLVHYRFFSPLIRHLLEGKDLWYKQVRGSRTNDLLITPVCSEEHGVEACIVFNSEDRTTPNKSISLGLMLRLSESTDVVGSTVKCCHAHCDEEDAVPERAQPSATGRADEGEPDRGRVEEEEVILVLMCCVLQKQGGKDLQTLGAEKMAKVAAEVFVRTRRWSSAAVLIC